ncbi:hypothetical protein ACUY3P_10610, partial [Corynebacterium lehmanniae]
HPQTALLVQPSSPRYLRSTHISYTDPSSIANPRRVYFPGARPDREAEADHAQAVADDVKTDADAHTHDVGPETDAETNPHPNPETDDDSAAGADGRLRVRQGH